MKIIAKIRTDFKEKFGIPRQSGLADNISKIIFEKEYRKPEALRGIEGYSHLWLIWNFSESEIDNWSATVRPPRLGGNKRIGVFATRSPYRPNPIGLSSVKLISVEKSKKDGTYLLVSGADLLDGTPIYDIKPYLSYTDSHPDAVGGFSDSVKEYALKVEISESLLSVIPAQKRETLKQILSNDPRPQYKEDSDFQYGMSFAGFQVYFSVSNGVLTVKDIFSDKIPRNH